MAAAETGQTLGTLLGGAAGTVVPGIGTAIGAQAGSAIGGLIGSGVQKRQGEQGLPAFEDPVERQRLNRLTQLQRSISSGTDVGTQEAIGRARGAGAQAQRAITRVSGGDVGGTLAGLLRSQRGTQSAVNQAVAQGQQRLPGLEGLSQQLGTRMSQRSLELQLLQRSQNLAESAQVGTESQRNLGSLLATQGGLPNQPPLSTTPII